MKRILLITCITVLVVLAVKNSHISAKISNNPEPSRVSLDTNQVLETAGAIFTPTNATELQGALDNAQLGDTIVLQAGVTYIGNFILPNKTTGSGYVTIQSSQLPQLPV